MDYLAETSFSSLMRESESQSNPDRYTDGSRGKENHQSHPIRASRAKRESTDKTNECLHGRSLGTREMEPSGDPYEERARLLEKGDWLAQKRSDSEREALCQTSTKAGTEVVVRGGENHEAYPFGEDFYHDSNKAACIPSQRSLPLLCWAFLSSLFGSSRRRSCDTSDKTKKGERKQLGGHEKEEQNDGEKLLDLLLMRIRIFARMSPAVSFCWRAGFLHERQSPVSTLSLVMLG